MSENPKKRKSDNTEKQPDDPEERRRLIHLDVKRRVAARQAARAEAASTDGKYNMPGQEEPNPSTPSVAPPSLNLTPSPSLGLGLGLEEPQPVAPAIPYRRREHISFAVPAYRVLKDMYPGEMGINRRGMTVLEGLISDLLEALASRAEGSLEDGEALTWEHISAALDDIAPGLRLTNNMHRRAKAALRKYCEDQGSEDDEFELEDEQQVDNDADKPVWAEEDPEGFS